jgi:hypothetical protein
VHNAIIKDGPKPPRPQSVQNSISKDSNNAGMESWLLSPNEDSKTTYMIDFTSP